MLSVKNFGSRRTQHSYGAQRGSFSKVESPMKQNDFSTTYALLKVLKVENLRETTGEWDKASRITQSKVCFNFQKNTHLKILAFLHLIVELSVQY